MCKSSVAFRSFAAGLLSVALTMLTACSSGELPQTSQTPAPASIDAPKEADLEARAQELAQREAALTAKEQEQENARQQAAAQAAAQAAQREREAKAKKAAQARRSSNNSTAVVANSTPATAAPVRVREPVEVPAGTQLAAALSSNLSTKTSKVGDAFEARLTSDLMIDGERLAPAGSRVTGTVTDVVSGSNSIGALPRLSLKFDNLEILDGQRIAIRGEFTQQGQSEKGRDAAKILGGAAAGAIIGHQVKHNDTGTVVGGLLGGAAGAVVAKKTGTEVELPDGATVTITLADSFKLARN